MTKKHRVAVFLNDMNATGGIQRVAANLARDLQAKYDTMILTVYPFDKPVFYESDITFKSLHMPYWGQFFPKPRKMLSIGWKLRRFVIDNEIDTVLAFWWHLAIIAAFVLPNSVKKIGCEHIAFSLASRYWQWIRRLGYPHLDAVVTLTKEDQPKFSTISQLACVIPNYVHAIDPDPIEKREKIILTVGHIEHRKGIDRLLWALKAPLHQNPDWKLVIIGGGEKGQSEDWYIPYLGALLSILNLDNRVEFYPATPRINDWYRKASIYVMGSRWEGFPMVLLEAKAHGLPIISFNCPTGPKEIIRPGVDGFLIDNDTLAFADAAQALMRDSDLRRQMSAAAIGDVGDRFSAEVVCRQWYALIDSLHEG